MEDARQLAQACAPALRHEPLRSGHHTAQKGRLARKKGRLVRPYGRQAQLFLVINN